MKMLIEDEAKMHIVAFLNMNSLFIFDVEDTTPRQVYVSTFKEFQKTGENLFAENIMTNILFDFLEEHNFLLNNKNDIICSFNQELYKKYFEMLCHHLSQISVCLVGCNTENKIVRTIIKKTLINIGYTEKKIQELITAWNKEV